jgi:tetratricopeptide (TPR) repeat protein
LGNSRETAATLSSLATLYLRQGNAAKARECEEEALGIFRELGDRLGEAIGLENLGEISLQQSDDASARQLFEQCLALARSIKHQELESECERNLGELALDEGDLQGAKTRLARSLQVCRDAEDKQGGAITLWCLGKTDAAERDYESARKKLAEALRAFEAFEMNSEAVNCLEDYAGLLQSAGRSEDAVRVYAAVAAVRKALALQRSPRGEAKRQANIGAARAALGDTAFDAQWSAGQTLALDDAIEFALEPSAAGQPVTA